MKKLFVLFLLASCSKSVMTPTPTQRDIATDSTEIVKPPVVTPVSIDTITVYEPGYKVNVFMTVSDTLGVVTIVATAAREGQSIAFVSVVNSAGSKLDYETVISFNPSGFTNTIKVLSGQKYVTGIKLN